ncbi:hypothetical protein AB0M20_01085 [Actinoplanes sp. NPDC051633]|uniref:hypothetical protein n=1 Tax=Actinoplanes sp. NPDC051633 TaxID=3155670 RepID=UPI003417D132
MSNSRRIALAAALGVAAVTAVSNPFDSRAMSLAASRGQVHGYGNQGFEIVGVPAKGLHPGGIRTVRLTFVNPAREPIKVTAVSGSVVSTSKAACKPKATNLVVRGYRGRLPVEVPSRGKKAAGELELYMPTSAADACKGVTFKIKMTGKAVKK